ncbi:MAG: asparagine synthase (glutamine-hydrolyzing) [Cyclobacteriaceae bacterium]|nr:asparagine synthase (glutamine-hydrolyzing) [Cyclobacteriaceae bacterium]
MCGISALVRKPDSSLLPLIEDFNKAITHRGPDGGGLIHFPEKQEWLVALGHQRLSIIDLSETGKQPMELRNEDIWITFNGEIYNYIELRTSLKARGYVFSSTSDTEVILAAYKEWGTTSFEKLQGMWAFVLYDLRKQKLIVCRDRMGIKPAYYFKHDDYIAFGSEIKQFLSLPNFKIRPNRVVVKQYVLTGFERSDLTFFENIHPVLPGTYMEVDLENLKLSEPVSFWNPEKIVPTVKEYPEAVELFGDVLHKSVRIHLRSDVQIACQLSGGVDSSAVLALMQEHYSGDAIHSFTVQFPGYQKDETPFVKRVLEATKVVPHFTTPESSSFQDDFKKFIWYHDEPVGSFAHYAGFVLAKLIAKHNIKVVLNGQGGDEILGGYWQQYFAYLLSSGKQGRFKTVLQHMGGALLREGNEHLIRQIPSMIQRYRSRQNKREIRFSAEYKDLPSLNFFSDYFLMTHQERRVFDIRNLILPRLLKWDDRNLMAFGVEGRYPFLDHKVIETTLLFDSCVLFKNGWTKFPLRIAMKDKLPKEIYFRKSKWGFETPQNNWLHGALQPMLSEWIKTNKPLDTVIPPDESLRIANQFWRTGKLEDAQMLLRLFLLDQWFQVFLVRT